MLTAAQLAASLGISERQVHRLPAGSSASDAKQLEAELRRALGHGARPVDRLHTADTHQVTEQTHQTGVSTCRKCSAPMAPGIAIAQTWGGIGDFAHDDVVTMSPSGPGKLVSCSKCTACGWSVSAADGEVTR